MLDAECNTAKNLSRYVELYSVSLHVLIQIEKNLKYLRRNWRSLKSTSKAAYDIILKLRVDLFFFFSVNDKGSELSWELDTSFHQQMNAALNRSLASRPNSSASK